MRLRTVVVGAMVAAIFVSAGCSSSRRSKPKEAQPPIASWQLMEPPQEPNAKYPRGYRVLSDAPLERWQPQGGFATFEECTQAMRDRIDGFIDHARAAVGADAKNDLAVRRAVHAKCIQTVPPATQAKR